MSEPYGRSYDDRCIYTFVSILVTLLIVSPFYIYYGTSNPKFHVDNVTLTQFTLSPTNNTLYYNLAVSMTIRNPSRHVGSKYHKIEANSLYHDQRFSTTKIQGFYLGHKSENNNVNFVFKGQQLVKSKDYKMDQNKVDNVYEIDMYLRFKMRYTRFLEMGDRYKVRCRLKVPLISSSAKFERTKCKFHSNRWIHQFIGRYHYYY